MQNFKDKDKAIQMIVDRTNGICHSPDSLVERLQQLLDLPCEICKDGVVLEEQEQKLKRGAVLLYNAIVYMEEMIGGSIENTDLENMIGITSKEYNLLKECCGEV